jgi:hypothetical protein
MTLRDIESTLSSLRAGESEAELNDAQKALQRYRDTLAETLGQDGVQVEAD